MIKNINFLGVPTRDKLNLFVSVGIFLIVLGFLDIIINTYFEINRFNLSLLGVTKKFKLLIIFP